MYWWVVYDVPEGGRIVKLSPTEEIIQVSPNTWYLIAIDLISYIVEAALVVAFAAAMVKEAVEVIKGEPRS